MGVWAQVTSEGWAQVFRVGMGQGQLWQGAQVTLKGLTLSQSHEPRVLLVTWSGNLQGMGFAVPPGQARVPSVNPLETISMQKISF